MSSAAAQLNADIARRQAQGLAFCVVTVVRAQAATAAKAGAKVLIDENGVITGFIGGACVTAAARQAAAQALAEGQARLIRVQPADKAGSAGDEGLELYTSGCPSRGTTDLFVEPMTPPPLLLVLGASPVALALARQAPAMGYRLRAAAAETETDIFAGIVDNVCTDFTAAVAGLTARDFVVVASQGRRDLDALRAALTVPAHYIAMVSSRAKAAHLLSRLAKEGVAAETLKRLKAPAGLDIQAIEPEEIALSVLAEMIQRRRRNVRDATLTTPDK